MARRCGLPKSLVPVIVPGGISVTTDFAATTSSALGPIPALYALGPGKGENPLVVSSLFGRGPADAGAPPASLIANRSRKPQQRFGCPPVPLA